MARDVFWLSMMLVVMAVLSLNALSHSSAWTDATFAPTPAPGTAHAPGSAHAPGTAHAPGIVTAARTSIDTIAVPVAPVSPGLVGVRYEPQLSSRDHEAAVGISTRGGEIAP